MRATARLGFVLVFCAVGCGGASSRPEPQTTADKAAVATVSDRDEDVVREFDDPLPPEAKDLDVVVDVLFYHDLFWMNDGKVDRAKMNAAIFRALKPGGSYVIVDHSGRAGTGSTEVMTLHRVEEKVVRDEILAAGFELAAEGDFLRNASDARDWNASPMKAAEKRGTSDRFVLRFVKP